MFGRYGSGLETFAIVATLLYVADGRTEQGRTILLSHGKKCDFAVELDEFFNDEFLEVATTARDAVLPCVLEVVGSFYYALTLARRGHQGFHNAGETNLLSRRLEFVERSSVEVFCCFKSQLFGSEVADGFAIHREVNGTRRGSDLNAFGFEVVEALCADGFDFGYDDVGAMFANCLFERFAIEHGENFEFISHLHSRSAGVGIARNDVLAQTLGGNSELLAEFATTKQ